MTSSRWAEVDRFAALLRPVTVVDFVSIMCRWLQDAHEAAAELQPLRKNHRGSWNNNTSFGTDRYQYLLSTAGSLTADLPDLEVDAAFQSVLLKLDKVGIYQFQAPAGPRGSVSDASDLRRELLEADEGPDQSCSCNPGGRSFHICTIFMENSVIHMAKLRTSLHSTSEEMAGE